MHLSRSVLETIKPSEGLFLPSTESFSYPEKVLQFGTGVLLRALPDFIINEANNRGVFKGRIVMVKSTVQGSVDAFTKQDGLYTVCVRGLSNGEIITENHVVGAVSRVLAAATEWNKVLECASHPEMQVIISNTTEVGITLIKESAHADPPASFPGKLLSFLYHRFKYFKGDPDKGMVVIPTELIPFNGDKLLALVRELAHFNNLEIGFIDWLENSNHFCNSLVDRIVPGKLKSEEQKIIEQTLGYKDELLAMSEVYNLWAIQSANEKVKKILSFSGNGSGAIIEDDIQTFRDLKLRLLNAPHTFACGLAFLAGFETVKEAVDDDNFSEYLKGLMFDEIIPSILSESITQAAAETFANKVLDRYRNSFIDHPWLSITLQYSTKMSMRNIAIIKNYYSRFQQVPVYMSVGLAAHILFLRARKTSDDGFAGEFNGNTYPIKDDNAAVYAKAWAKAELHDTVKSILSGEDLWETDLNNYVGLTESVLYWLTLMLKKGVTETLAMAVQQKMIVINEK